MIPETSLRKASRWDLARAGAWPLALLAALLAAIVFARPDGRPAGEAVPPVERLAIERITLQPGGMTVSVLNDGPDRVTIAQVMVDEAYWAFTTDRGTALHHLDRTRLSIPYPWVEGDAHVVRILTSTGAAFERAVPVAVRTPRPNAASLMTFALIGIYVGVIPIALGMLWLPLAARLGRTGLDALLALTVGLLLFLLVDAAWEGLETAVSLPGSYQGVPLFAAGAAAAWLALETVGARMRARRTRGRGAGTAGFVLALLIAAGIGLHNFGEGLAVGAAFALGEAGLGTMLIVGFTLHNATEGLAIVSPIARDRPALRDLVRLGLIGGAPTVVGAWLGGFVQSPVVAVLCLALGAGAIAQVVVQIVRQMAAATSVAARLSSGPVLAGLAGGFAIMYATGVLVGS